ncbi:hypothetical protein BKA70DRAFT_552284 [Coprinopsis sp. MPI-PUGE-AT-0042]|nr:hypothetical protein BKA70DRAFT_552284 [Coprinopsis sp. MPI-PUGE-AT-0042]
MGAFVERSRNAPMSVTLHLLVSTSTSIIRSQVNAMLSLQASRITSIALTVDRATAVDLAEILSSPVPLLKMLQVKVVRGSQPSLRPGALLRLADGYSLPCIQAPLLRHVEFTNCALPWNSSSYRTITSIDITFEGFAPPFTSQEVHRGLEALAPHLQKLRLHFDIKFDETSADVRPIPLPSLKYLDLGKGEYEPYDSMGLFPFLHLPNSVTPHLCCDWSHLDDIELMCSGLSIWASAPLSMSSHPPIIESLSIEYDDEDGDFVIQGWRHYSHGKPKDKRVAIFSDAVELDAFDMVTSAILKCLPLRNLVALHLAGAWTSEFDMRHIFSNLPLLEEITFSQYVTQVQRFASLLLENALETSKVAGESDTLVPSLEEITLERILPAYLAATIERLSLALHPRTKGGKGGIQMFTLKECGAVTEDMLLLLRNGPGVDNIICID